MQRFNKIRRFLLRAVLVCAGTGLVAFLGGNLYLRTESGKGRVEERLERIAGCPVRLERVGVSLLGTIELGALALGDAGPGLEVASVEARLALRSLLRGKLEVREIATEGLRLRIVERPPVAPSAIAENGQGSPEEERPHPQRVPPPMGDPAPKGQGIPLGREASPQRPPRSALERFRFSDAEVVLYASDGTTERLRVEGIAAEGETGVGGTLAGKIGFQTLRGPGSIEVTGGSASLAFENGTITLEGGDAACGGGYLSGGFVLHTGRPGAPFRMAISTKEVEATGLLEALGGGDLPLTAGTVEGTLIAEGWLRAPTRTRCRVNARLKAGRLAFPSGKGAGKLLIGDEDGSVPVVRAEASLLFIGGRGIVESATFEAGPLMLKSTGYLTTAGGLRLSLRTYLGQGRGEGPAIAAMGLPRFTRLAGTDWFYHDFALEGTVQSPFIGPLDGRERVALREFIGRISSGREPAGEAEDLGLQPVSARSGE